MRKELRNRLERAGFRVGTVAEFLNLSPEEEALVELKVTLASSLQRRRVDEGMTQAQLAARLGTSQSRVAKMEGGDRTVSIDLLVRAMFAMGVSRQALARVIGAGPKNRAA